MVDTAAHTSILFEAYQKMEIDIWDSISVSTNTEEAIYWKLYAATGHNHLFLEGLQAVYAVAAYSSEKSIISLGCLVRKWDFRR